MKQYEYVAAIAKYGSISQAADALDVAQPTLSKYLKKLESDLGVELFDRSTIPLSMTKAGEKYVETGKQILMLENELQKFIDEYNNRPSVIRVGISTSRSPYLMPVIIAAYQEKYPNHRIVISEGKTDELQKKLIHGDVDLIISLLDDESAAFEHIPLFNEDVLLAVPKSAAEKNSSVMEILKNSPLITVGKGQVLWQSTQGIIDTVDTKTPLIECQSVESALAMVRCGLGVTLIPSYIYEFGNAQNREIYFIKLPDELSEQVLKNGRRTVCVFYRREQFLSKAEKAFIECAKEVKQLYSFQMQTNFT
ncbi:MAG: LysR family transcriptional regulator [Ruminococcus sp.]|nr:LysR family transcriptional regulator [Ruminococcus sp.]